MGGGNIPYGGEMVIESHGEEVRRVEAKEDPPNHVEENEDVTRQGCCGHVPDEEVEAIDLDEDNAEV